MEENNTWGLCSSFGDTEADIFPTSLHVWFDWWETENEAELSWPNRAQQRSTHAHTQTHSQSTPQDWHKQPCSGRVLPVKSEALSYWDHFCFLSWNLNCAFDIFLRLIMYLCILNDSAILREIKGDPHENNELRVLSRQSVLCLNPKMLFNFLSFLRDG